MHIKVMCDFRFQKQFIQLAHVLGVACLEGINRFVSKQQFASHFLNVFPLNYTCLSLFELCTLYLRFPGLAGSTTYKIKVAKRACIFLIKNQTVLSVSK